MGKAMTMSTKLQTQLHISLLLVLLPAHLTLAVSWARASPKPASVAKPGCKDSCGNVSIPYPFGIGRGCFFDPWFEIECDHSKAMLSKFNIELLEIGQPPELKVRIPPLNVCTADSQRHHQSQRLVQSGIDLRGSPYKFSIYGNFFLMEGCPGSAVMVNQSTEIMGGCGTVCHTNNTAMTATNDSGVCYGVNCCQSPLPESLRSNDSYSSALQFYQVEFSRPVSAEGDQDCLMATLVEFRSVDDYVGRLSSSQPASFPPVLLEWTPLDLHLPRHHPHAFCYRSDGNYVSCECHNYYTGNPYLSNGCQAPEGCEGCKGDCVQDLRYPGSSGYYCINPPLLNLGAILGLSIGFGLLLLAACVYGLYGFIKRRREKKRKVKFFKRNGGLLLQQQLTSAEGVVDRTKIFTVSELDKATNRFDKNRILGKGGQGTVYKGMLPDGSIVAIKKSILLDESQLEQFINEVVILSGVNHRHVVKLYGCCLETEIPLLVYEFIQNGTLFQHIHEPNDELAITWQMRLKIAADSASAIAYLHSSSSIPIYHRDIKSSNILLDEKHRAKVSDFGSSKTIAIDQTHMTTIVQGTMGYLDPEYFQTYQVTEKSDVYSFGVVVLELLTSKRPIYRDEGSMEQKNLVTEFLFLSQTSRLTNILDPKIVCEAKEDELISVVELVKRCVSWSGKMRPTMKQVAMTLEMIIKSPAQVSSWYRQQEDFPIQYAGYDEFDMSGISDAEFMSTTLHPGDASPPYNDARPLLPDTI